jgi:CubicO group peptidase (beta-lactamase class C family)
MRVGKRIGVAGLALSAAVAWSGNAAPELQAVSEALQAQVDKGEIAGAVSLVLTPDRVVHFGACGLADLAAKKPMANDALFWIASMSKPVTACAVLMLQDEGKLSVDDLASKYLPELAGLKTADGRAGRPTLKHLLTHTAGLSEPTEPEALASRTLAELMPHIASKPLQSLPGERWQYSQSGINALGRIVEVASGKPLQEFLKERLFVPLGMKDTTFYPDAAQRARLAKAYRLADGRLEEAGIKPSYDCLRGDDRYPAANGGLYSTAADYGRLCQMLLNRGTLDGKRVLSPEAVAAMASVQSGELKTGFVDGMAWGLGCGVVRQPQGVTAVLSPGTFGHGGAYGTQAWVDPVRRVAYVLMVQRANFPNGDASDVRRQFQAAAAKALDAAAGQ